MTIDSEPWFVAKDVCEVLTVKNSRDKIVGLDDDEKDDVGISGTIGRQKNMTIISESGLYSSVLTSRKPEAKRFKQWVTSEVRPTISKTGIYGQPVQQKQSQSSQQQPDMALNALETPSAVIELQGAPTRPHNPRATSAILAFQPIGRDVVPATPPFLAKIALTSLRALFALPLHKHSQRRSHHSNQIGT